MTRLKILQKKAIRTICKAKYNSHTEPLFKKTKVLKVDDIFCIECTKIVLKSRNKLLPSYFSDQIIVNSNLHNHSTRQSQDLHCNAIKSRLEEQLINTKLSIVWNHLTEVIGTSLTSTSSTIKLKQYILENYQETCIIINCPICNRL